MAEQIFNVALVKEYLKTDFPVQLDVQHEVTSTNTILKELAEQDMPEGFVLIAQSQTAGRGRLGRSFHSPVGTGLYFSVLLRPTCSAERSLFITTSAAVAVCRAIENLTDKKPLIKWVNDIYLDEKKICGILTEAITDPQDSKIRDIWIGIGINVTPMTFPEELKSIAASLDVSELDRNELIANIINQLLYILRDSDRYAHMPYYRAHSMVIGKAVNTICADQINPGVVLDIDREGGLVVERPNGTIETLHSGEISLRLQ